MVHERVKVIYRGPLIVEQGEWERGIAQMRQDESELLIEARQ